MISIIICSIDQQKFSKVSESISETIGADYEIIKVDNLVNNFSICKAYNYGVKYAKGDYLCFMHEDIIFKSDDWGTSLIEFVDNNKDCGIIGFAGTDYVSSFHAFWWYNGNIARNYSTLSSDNADSLILKRTHSNQKFIPVTVLDGLFLFCKKDVWELEPFDEVTFDHFHFYDMDFSISKTINGKQNYVCNTVDLIHLSSGTLARPHFDNAIKFRAKYKDILPFKPRNYNLVRVFFNELTSAYRLVLYSQKVGADKYSVLEEIKIGNSLVYIALIVGFPLYNVIRKIKHSIVSNSK